MTQLTEHFSEDEMKCPCCNVCTMDQYFMDKLERYRAGLGFPLKVNSGYRCAKHNEEIGGASSSRHLVGRAADICWIDKTATQKYHMVMQAKAVGFTGIGIAKTFIHVDNRATGKALWMY